MVHPWFTTNLPPEAATMNDSYLRAAFPPDHQAPEEIRRLLDDAKITPSASMMAMTPADDAYDASIENAIREDLQAYGRASGSASLQQFINTHSGVQSAGGSLPAG